MFYRSFVAAAILSLAAPLHAQTYPSPTFNNVTLQGTFTIGGVTQVFPTSGLLVGTTDVQTLTGKTFDTAGSGNVFKINGTQISSITGTGAAVLANNPSISGAVLSGGSINNAPIGATTPNTGSFTTLALSGATTQSATSQFYQNFGANVNRVNDRLFVGPATLNNATNVASQPDWLTQYQLAKGRTYGYVQTSQFSVLNDQPSQGSLTTAVFGAKSSPPLSGGSQAIAVTGMGINNANNGQPANAAWAGYFEAFRDTTSAGNGGAYGIEIDTMNYVGSAPVTDPYSQANDQTIGLQMASGGGFPGTLYPTTVGLNFQNNNTTFDKGIVFGSNSITGATGTSGSGVAIALGNGHMLQWYGGAGIPTSRILSNGTTQAGGIQQLFSENSATFSNASSKSLFKILGVSSGVNGIQALGAATGQAVAVQAIGDDTNIPMQISGKGTGGVQVLSTAVSGNSLTVTSTSNTVQGASILLQGNGATTPNKYIRALNGAFQIANSANSGTPMSMDDSGNVTFTGTVSGSSFPSPSLTGVPTAPTASAGTNTTQVATTAFVTASPTINTPNITGVTSGATASAGSLGENLTGNTSATSMTNGTTANCTSKILTAGDWIVWGTAQFSPAASTTFTGLYAGLSTTAATLPSYSQMTSLIATFTTGQPQIVPTPMLIQNVSSSTTVYLVGNTSFGTSTMTCSGTINAIRYH